MFLDFILIHAPAIVAAVVFVPVLAFSIALFVEGARKTRWSGTRKPRPDASKAVRKPQSQPRAPVTIIRGPGLRHGVAARRDHD